MNITIEVVSLELSRSWHLEHLHISSSDLLLIAWCCQIGCTFYMAPASKRQEVDDSRPVKGHTWS